MPANAMKLKQRLILSLEKLFKLPIYTKQVASMFAKFGTKKTKHYKPTYALNVLPFIDGSASKGRETSNSSTDEDSMTESTAT